ncbi:TonB-dependent receptor domain-containing protein [Altericroceibacterium xinjiangense]|uniref:TonB-dependent receptor domain-containing protein n=1 Tax=Altericroceibacterium xinjiangense TaxID=762261 RepID=UPI000F7E7A0C|nr:TonB-dependent receptor [Altericroceibacterium xinjiangense]
MKKLSILKAGSAPLAIGLAIFATPAFGQATPPAAAPLETLTENADGSDPIETQSIIVTGSRLAQPNLVSTSPVTVVAAEELRATGTTRVEDLVNSLPQVFAGQGATISNGSTGTATLNLRGLGSERTLVLINGRRAIPGDPSTSAADINIIPGALVKRIDVLTGGASSVYGADAVSGVVNFIMDTDFEGFRIDAQGAFYQHDNDASGAITDALDARGFTYPSGNVVDGRSIDVTASFGAGFDDGRGHVTAYAGYRKINAILQGARDYSSCALNAGSATASSRFSCGGSLTSPNGSFIVYDSFGDPTDVEGGGPEGDQPDGIADAFTSTLYQIGNSRAFIPGATTYNYNPLNYFQRPDERYTAGLFADYEISDAARPYLEFMFMDDRTVAQIAPSGNFGNTFSINCNNPLLSAQQLAIVCDNENLLVSASPSRAFDVVGNTGEAAFDFIDPTTGDTYNRGFAQILRRNVEGGGRQDDLQHTNYRAVIGMRGELSPIWSYDAFYQYGRTIFAQTYLNDFSVTRLTRALDVVTDPDSGAAVCRSTLDGTDANCVPYDIFAPGGVTDAALNYLQVPGFTRGLNTTQVANAAITGDLTEYGFASPWANSGAALALGVEYRKETLDFKSDVSFQIGDLAGQGAPTLPVAGAFDVKEIFGELRIPLIQDSFIYDASITGGYRYSSYDVSSGRSFSTDTYKIEGEIALTPDIRFRGGYNRAVRVPTLQDFFAPNRVALQGTTDPCAKTDADGNPVAIAPGDVGCLAQGLSVGQIVAENPSSQYNGLIGGNVDLMPETADTYTAGVVLSPRFVPGLAISVDYFDITVDDAIQAIGADTIVTQCTNTADPFFCDLVNRDASGSLWRTPQGFVVNTQQNIGSASTSGVDVNAGYTRTLGPGRFTSSFVGTWLNDLTTDPGVGGAYDCVGLYGANCGTPNPEWRHQMRVGFELPSGIGTSVRWRYFSSVEQDTTSDNPALEGTVQPANAKIPSVNYIDLTLTYDMNDETSFRMGVNNLFDKAPPIIGQQACSPVFCNGNTYPAVYDALGRYVFVGLTLDL